MAGGALASAFVPTVTGFLARDDRRGAWQLSSAILNLVFLVTAGLSLLSAVFAPYIVAHTATASSFPSSPMSAFARLPNIPT